MCRRCWCSGQAVSASRCISASLQRLFRISAEAWVNTGALLNRLNYSLALASNRMNGVRVDATALLGADDPAQPDTALDRAIAVLLSGEASPETRQTLQKQMNDPQVLQASLDDPVKQINKGIIAGLVLGMRRSSSGGEAEERERFFVAALLRMTRW